MAGRVLLKIVYLLVRRILGLAVLLFGRDMAKDAELLVVNKPAGMVVHPGAGTTDDTLVHALLSHCESRLGIFNHGPYRCRANGDTTTTGTRMP